MMMACATLLALTACGDDEGAPPTQESPTATAVLTPGPTGTPSATTAVPTRTPTGSPEPSPTIAPPGATIDLATTAPKLTIFAADQGDLRNDTPGLAVGDFNDDGIGDLLVGARFGDGPDGKRETAGEAYVIFGSATLPSSMDIRDDPQDMTIFGAEPGDSLGFSVAAADVNHDGIDDVIVSAPTADGPGNQRTDPGETHVIFGSADLGGDLDLSKNQPDITIFGAEGFSRLGDSLATCDVNDDGITDIIMGAPFAGRVPGSPHGGPRTELGEVYVVFGSATLAGLVSVPEAEQDFTISGPEQWSELGDAVACGDVNGDGIADIIAAAEAADGPEGARRGAGTAYVVFGSASLGGTVRIAEDEQDVAILGADIDGALGFSAASGDVNGDGLDDILLVAQRAEGPDNARKRAGEAYIILGSSALGGSTIDVLAKEEDVTIFGMDPHDLLSFCGADDVDGDGIGDILLGTSFGDGPENARDDAGEAYILFGSSALPATIDLAQGGQDVVLFGAESTDRMGASIAVGDIDGDGTPELITAATEADGPENARPEAGEVYIVTSPGLSR